MTALSCHDAVTAQVRELGARFSCYADGERLWVVSPFSHPDDDLIEVAVRELPSGELLVSDLGETLRHLSTLGFDPRTAPRGDYLLAETLKRHHVELDRGMIGRSTSPDHLGTAMHDVLSAALGVAHLVYLARGSRPATFTEEVSQFLADQGIATTTRHPEIGASGKKYTVDLYVQGAIREGLFQPLSPATPAGATPMVNATFRLWSDISNHRLRATVLDDRKMQWRPVDLILLAGVSSVYRWSEQQQALAEAIATL